MDLCRRNRPGVDTLTDTVLCVSEADLPCTGSSDPGKAFAGTRSQHAGGIFVLVGDGSVRFIKDTADTWKWIGFHSINGEEVLSDSSY
jgi:hypothetical protein